MVGIRAGVAMESFEAGMISEVVEILGDGEFNVLKPETWVGKRFPLLKHIDVDETLTEGQWLALLYHLDCSECQEEIKKLPKG